MEPRSTAREVFLDFPVPRDRLIPPTQVRTTLVASSYLAIRERGLGEAYAAAVDPAWRDRLVEAVAGSWLPIAAGVAHYRACDRLVAAAADQFAIGRAVGDRLHTTFLGKMIRAARDAGLTPWTAFSNAQKFYERLFDGGGCRVTKLGPKDAGMEMAGNPLVSIAYFRNATRGVWASAIELFCQKAYMRDLGRTDSSFEVKISWT